MCKTYEAIYEIKKCMESDVLVAWVSHAEIRGTLTCDCGCDEDKYLDGVLVLKDATVKCKECNKEKSFKQINVPTKWIKAFCFECCEKEM